MKNEYKSNIFMRVLIPNVYVHSYEICGIEICMLFQICYLPLHFDWVFFPPLVHFVSSSSAFSPLPLGLPDDHTNINFTVMFT